MATGYSGKHAVYDNRLTPEPVKQAPPPREPSAMVTGVLKAMCEAESTFGCGCLPDHKPCARIARMGEAAIAAVLDHLPRAVFAAGMDPDYADDENVLAHIEAGIAAVKESIR